MTKIIIPLPKDTRTDDVLQCLYDLAKPLSSKSFSIREEGLLRTYGIQHVHPPNNNQLEIKYLSSTLRDGDDVSIGDFVFGAYFTTPTAIVFEVWPRQIEVEFEPVFKPILDEILRVTSERLGWQQATQETPKRRRTGMQDDTPRKLKILREYRNTFIETHGSAPKKVIACDQAGITYKTVKENDPELLNRWYDKDYK
jgi:hypothetical protein